MDKLIGLLVFYNIREATLANSVILNEAKNLANFNKCRLVKPTYIAIRTPLLETLKRVQSDIVVTLSLWKGEGRVRG